ncbi:MAG: DUF4476 domain-containing protein [Bacteroidetes bacterium]|nr:DUF4476 domain-containing protein [Bacteroidota bacterium]
MNKLICTLLLSLFSSFAFAQKGNKSIIKVKLSDNSPFTISIDGRNYNKVGKSIIVGDLPSGRHYLKIYSYTAYTSGRGGRARVMYEADLRISKGTITTLTYDMEEQKLYAKTEFIDGSYSDEQVYADDHSSNNNSREDIYDNGSFSKKDMQDLKQRVDDRITDTDKQKLMQSVLGTRSYSTEQMREMLSWLGFESTRVEFAKWGYNNVTDKKNYWKLESEFTFSSSKDDFNKYINSKR